MKILNGEVEHVCRMFVSRNENEEKIFHFNILNMMMWIPDGVIKNSPLRLCPDALGYEVR